MTGSMYASVAGLKAHMQKLSVIGKQRGNVNTQGYKKQRTVFPGQRLQPVLLRIHGTSSVEV